MMVQPGTFDRVYAAIKQRILEGAIKPGQKLEPALLSEELNASVTPVRDALHRLVGERLVEAPRHEGFRAPLLGEMALRHLYAWHLDMLLIAIGRKGFGDTPVGEGEPGEPWMGWIFAQLIESSGNRETVATFANLAERLEPYRRQESRLLDAVEEECAHISRAVRARDRRGLRQCLVRYHRRRQRLVADLIESFRADQ